MRRKLNADRKQGIKTPEELAEQAVEREHVQQWLRLRNSNEEYQWGREERQWEIEQDQRQWAEVDIFTDEFTEPVEQPRKSYVTLTDPQRTFEGWQTAGELWEAQQPLKPVIPVRIEPTNESFGTARYCSSCA